MKTITVNFNIKQDNNLCHFITKDIKSDVLTEFILNFYGQMNIGRSVPKELDILIITYNEDDKKQIEQELLNI